MKINHVKVDVKVGFPFLPELRELSFTLSSNVWAVFEIALLHENPAPKLLLHVTRRKIARERRSYREKHIAR